MKSTSSPITLLAVASGLALVLSLPNTGCGKGKDKDQKKAEPVEKEPVEKEPVKPAGPDAAALLAQAKTVFQGPLPERFAKDDKPVSEAKVALGRMLYFDTRLSKNHDISCNSCHDVAAYGVDVREPEGKRQTSKGHKGQLGGRNSPTSYNAAGQFRQFWDGRAADVEEQAKGPVLNPIEMAMPDEKSVVAVLKSIPGYVQAFGSAYPGAKDPVTYDKMAFAIGEFERGLVTPSRFDQFLGGKLDALNEQELRGLDRFIKTGCTACHIGPLVGGTMYQKLGLLKPYDTKDTGRFEVTKNEADKFMFKVPILRNIEKTGPYLHDGSIATLDEMVDIMAEYQTAGGKLKPEEVGEIVAFLEALTGELPKDYIAKPELPPSGPKTPKPDPS